jgi:hypothetical protein
VPADSWHFGGGTVAGSWRIAHGATVTSNNLELTLFHTGPSPSLIGFQCSAARQSDAAGSHRMSKSFGAITTGGKTLTSLHFILSNGATSFSDAWWWVEGLRMTHPS